MRTANPKAGTQGLIPIVPGPGSAVGGRPAGHVDPYAFWSEYYRKHDESAAQLRETLRLLNLSKKFTDVHAALTAYLTERRKNAEPWMYEALAIAIEMIDGKPEDIKTALHYGADLAQRTHNPNHLVSVADLLFRKGYYEQVGPLLDEAAARIPHRAEPLVMSINLAQNTRDPKRMGDAIDTLLALGWPGSDDYLRREARKQAVTLAEKLKEDGRNSDADALLARVTAAESRDVYIRLTWDGNADYDLVVEEPLGAKAQLSMPRTVFGGSIIKNGYGSHPEEVYVCPRGFDGDYTVRVVPVYADPENAPTRLTLESITHEGTINEAKDTRALVPEDPQAKPLVVSLKGGRRKTVLPFLSPGTILESVFGSADPAAGPGARAKAPTHAAAAPARSLQTPRTTRGASSPTTPQ
ncbi:MAG TPA: hypothetical protein VJY33_11130 [Isosphaeraceae bacterium]|nr:hypothetical protein [Isosphaeraceae bacterium]